MVIIQIKDGWVSHFTNVYLSLGQLVIIENQPLGAVFISTHKLLY